MNAQALTVPVTRLSVPALLVAAAGTAAAVSVAVVVLDERTVVERSSVITRTVDADRYNPGDAYAAQLERRRLMYLESLHDR